MIRNYGSNKSHWVTHMSLYYGPQRHLNKLSLNKCYFSGKMACILENFLNAGRLPANIAGNILL